MRAFCHDIYSAKKQEAIAGGGDNVKDLRHTFAYQLVPGRPELMPELTYPLQGVKAEYLVRRKRAAQLHRRRRLHPPPRAGSQAAGS